MAAESRIGFCFPDGLTFATSGTIMFWLKLIMLSSWLASQMPQGDSGVGPAEVVKEFKLTNGDVLRGEVGSMNEDGLVVRLAIGGFSDRISWTKLTQETLKKLATNPGAREYVEPFIEIPPEIKARQRPKKREFHPKAVPRVELPAGKTDFMATVSSPLNLAALGLLFAANLFAAYEVAVYRNRPIALVCGLSVVLPVIGPGIFLALPNREEAFQEPSVEPADAAAVTHQTTTHPLAQGGLGIAKAEKSSGTGAAQLAIYKRGDTTFNRRFFETKFPGFFRVVPSEAEKDLMLVIKTGKEEIQARRIARITANEMHLQLLHGGGKEASVTFGDIAQVQIRQKDSKA